MAGGSKVILTWRIATSGKAHAFTVVYGRWSVCYRTMLEKTRLGLKGEEIRPCALCVRRLKEVEALSKAIGRGAKRALP